VGYPAYGFYPSRVIWVAIHKWGGLGISTAVLLHVIIHWRWLIETTRRTFRRKRSQVESRGQL
jgi:hypothetical protein